MTPFILLALFLACCSSPPPLKSFKGNVMTIDYHIAVSHEDQEDRIQTIIKDVFLEVDAIYNKWNPASEVSKFNAHKSQSPLSLSPKFYKLLSLTDQIVDLTEGRCDPTIEPVQQLWKKALEQGIEPDPDAILSLKPAIGWDKIHFDHHTIRKDHPLTEIDLGGIAKGYAVDLLFEALQGAGFKSIYVEWGGEIRASAAHPEGRPWKIGIVNPHLDQPIHFDLSDASVATSGDYEQFWTLGNKTYFHIIDPKTLKPLEIKPDGISSVTVLAKTCVLADGIAKTGLFFDTQREAEAWAEPLTKKGFTFFFQQRKIPVNKPLFKLI